VRVVRLAHKDYAAKQAQLVYKDLLVPKVLQDLQVRRDY
jgi:hypothetical protein